MSAEEYLTAEQVLAEADAYCAARGNPKVAEAMRYGFKVDGKVPPAALRTLRLKAVTMYQRLPADEAAPKEPS